MRSRKRRSRGSSSHAFTRWASWWFFWIFALFIIGWAFVRAGVDRSGAHKDVLQKEAAEDTLRRRFAAGEIDEEEYARRMKVLREK
jgi:putative membrane protein